MCDTFVALPDATADGSVIFGKNSDRHPNEAHHLLLIPRARHPAGSTVKLTYLELPQVEETYAVLLAKPFWIWGAEMGANEHGVVIGNEAVFTKVPYDKGPGLIGMDFIRLALERTATARAALELITALLAEHGQGGNCGFGHKLYYHNSFIIADPREAWVLETAGREWAAQRVTSGVRSISNAITIGDAWDLASPGLVDYAVRRGWCRGQEDFHFGRCYSDFLYTRFSAAHFRQSCTTQALTARSGRITVADAMAVLRDHGSAAGPGWTPARGVTGATVCMHAGWGPVRISQSVGSLVSHLRAERQTHWVTGTSAPCTGIFKPVWLDAGLPDLGPAPTGVYDAATLWWRHEALHREVLRDYAARLPLVAEERDARERQLIAEAEVVAGRPAAERAAFTAQSFAQADAAAQRWLERVRREPVRSPAPWHHRLAWTGFNRSASFPA
ncbi:MAG: C69 family dipeptidase [Anaerolineae bacterium]|nr:C69 family dipeptidase [Anaerolineae bacterium]